MKGKRFSEKLKEINEKKYIELLRNSDLSVIKKSFDNSISIEVEKRFGRQIVFPNSIAKKYAQEIKKDSRELDFVLFYDLDLRTRKAYKSNELEFSKRYKRNVSYYRKRDMLRYFSTILEFK